MGRVYPFSFPPTDSPLCEPLPPLPESGGNTPWTAGAFSTLYKKLFMHISPLLHFELLNRKDWALLNLLKVPSLVAGSREVSFLNKWMDGGIWQSSVRLQWLTWLLSPCSFSGPKGCLFPSPHPFYRLPQQLKVHNGTACLSASRDSSGKCKASTLNASDGILNTIADEEKVIIFTEMEWSPLVRLFLGSISWDQDW